MALDDRIKELIAVGASVTANCHPCLKYHVREAFASGACADEVAEAVEMGRMVRRGAARKLDELAATLTEGPPADPSAPDQGGGCGE